MFLTQTRRKQITILLLLLSPIISYTVYQEKPKITSVKYDTFTFPDFSFKDISQFIIRAPCYSAVLFVLLKLDFLRSSFWFFLNFFFAVHVISVGLITTYIIKSTGLLVNFENYVQFVCLWRQCSSFFFSLCFSFN